MSDITDRLEVRKHRTYEENLAVAAASLKKITGYNGPIEDREVARKYFDHFTLKPVTAHGLPGQGVSISYVVNEDRVKQATATAQAPRPVGGCAPALPSYKW